MLGSSDDPGAPEARDLVGCGRPLLDQRVAHRRSADGRTLRAGRSRRNLGLRGQRRPRLLGGCGVVGSRVRQPDFGRAGPGLSENRGSRVFARR